MKLQFSADQNYQLQAVQSAVAIFEGQLLAKSDFEISLNEGGITSSGQTTIESAVFGVGNPGEEQMLNNILVK